MEKQVICNGCAREGTATLPMKKDLDKFRGCLLGGAAGDALGYTVEFMSEDAIFGKFGEDGITEYVLRKGKAWISDDTQMTMFTAEGLLLGTAGGCQRDIPGQYTGYIAQAYRDWYQTQMGSFERCHRASSSSRLLGIPQLFAARAPGNTCLSAIRAGCCGTIENPANHSKGCGGVMRVAPIGLYFGESGVTAQALDMLGAEAAALTHGHEMGYIPAAMLVHIIRLVAHNGEITLKDAVLRSMEAMEALFPQAKTLPEFLALMGKAVELAAGDTAELDAIHQLGEGWVGDEALAIAVYCALKHADNFDKAMIAAVNHKGDSDSTGAIAGNILGAYLGLAGIPEKYLKKLELADVLMALADALYEA